MTTASRRWAATLLAALGAAALVAVLVLVTRSPEVVAPTVSSAPAAAPSVVEGDWPVVPAAVETVHPTSFVVADAVGPSIPLWASPAVPLGEELANPTWEGLPLVFVVRERTDGWLRVGVSTRPNGREAWVRAADVTTRRVPNWIQVEVGARQLTVYHGDTALLSTTVAVGRDATPTPLGSFFVDGSVALSPPDPAYGAGQLSVSGFSPTLASFGGGVGQIALHGTNAPGVLGQAASNGCVRLDNEAIVAVMDLAPTGTPVEIVA